MDAMTETTLTATHRHVTACLARFADHKTGRNARPTVRTLADVAGVHTETVLAALDAAERAGLIRATARAHRRPTVWEILPDDSGVRPTRTPLSGSPAQPCAASVRHLSGSVDSTTETTTLRETSPRDESSASTHTPTTNGEAGGDTDPRSDLAPEARAFALELAALACTKAAGRLELCDLADIAEYGSSKGYRHVTARQFFDAARDKRIRSMDKHAPTIFAEAARSGRGAVTF